MSKHFILIFLLMLTSACNTIDDEEEITPVVDTDDDFSSATAGGVVLQYKADSDSLHCILSAATTGWLSVGFDPSSQMKDANFIIAYVNNGTLFIRDDFGVTNTQHQSDLSLGGTHDIRPISASETDGTSSVEFKIPLESGDQYDRPLTVDNTYSVIFAFGSGDDYNSYHSSRAVTTITIE